MLSITERQYSGLEASVRDRFVKRAAKTVFDHLREGEVACSQAEALALAQEATERAEPYGIVDLPSVADLAVIIATVNPAFDDDDKVQAVLGNPNIPPEQRVQVLIDTPWLWALAAGEED